jgi:filamentous hemagglutinin family protein
MNVQGQIVSMRSLLMLLLLEIGIALLAPTSAQAQIVPDDTLGTERSQVSTETIRGLPNDQIDGGAIRGSNLFHSFQEFNVEAGRGAYFSNPVGVENIFSRVTGDNPSTILGGLGTLGKADLFFINSNGILFGPNSFLDVEGSFVGTTSDDIVFGEAGVFGTTNPEIPSQILSVNPSAFLFTAIAPNTGITQQSASLDRNNPSFVEGLRVLDGFSLLLLGDEIQLQQGTLNASSGRVELLALGEPGSVGLTIEGDRLDLAVPGTLRPGTIASVQGTIDTSGIRDSATTGGDIQIQGGQVTLDNTVIISNNFGSQDNGGIYLQGTQVDLNRSSLLTNASAAGDGGDISVNANTLNIRNGGAVSTTSFLAQGSAGDIDMQVTDAFNISNQALLGSSFLGSPLVQASGSSGNFSVAAGSLNIENSAISVGTTLGQVPGGNIIIRANDSINLTDGVLSTLSAGNSPSGNISIETGNLILSGNNSRSLIRAEVVNPTQFFSSAQRSFPPEVINLLQPLFTNLDPASFGQADSGTISIEASDTISIADTSSIATLAVGQARGGDLNVTADTLEMTGYFSSISSEANFDVLGSGSGGDVSVESRILNVQEGARISSSSFGSGRGGNLRVTATEQAQLTGNATSTGRPVSPSSILSASGLFTVGTANGDAGSLQFEGGQLQISDGGTISAAASGVGNAGDLAVSADTLSLNNSDITTAAANTSGGNITLTARGIYLLGDSDIRTNSAQNGGNIVLSANTVVALDDSDIFASAASGTGGDITVNTPAFFANFYPLEAAEQSTDPLNNNNRNAALLDNNNRTDLDATGQISSGVISVPDTSFVQNDLSELSGSLVDGDQFVATSCIARTAQDGSLVVTRANGLPETPQNTNAAYPTGTVRSSVEVDADDAANTAENEPWQLGDRIQEPQAFYTLSNGRMVLSQSCSD